MRSPAVARKWLVISALVVAGVWGYRRWREGPTSLTKFPEFITGWGATYFILAMITEAAPRFGGSFSVLVMVADVLYNAMPSEHSKGLLADLTGQQKGKSAASTPLDTNVTVPTTPVGKPNIPAPGAGREGAAAAAVTGR